MTRDGYSAWPGDWTDAVRELAADIKEREMTKSWCPCHRYLAQVLTTNDQLRGEVAGWKFEHSRAVMERDQLRARVEELEAAHDGPFEVLMQEAEDRIATLESQLAEAQTDAECWRLNHDRAVHERDEAVDEMKATLPEVVAVLEATDVALDRHGRHQYGADDARTCGAYHSRPCTCGLQAARDAVRALLTKLRSPVPA